MKLRGGLHFDGKFRCWLWAKEFCFGIILTIDREVPEQIRAVRDYTTLALHTLLKPSSQSKEVQCARTMSRIPNATSSWMKRDGLQTWDSQREVMFLVLFRGAVWYFIHDLILSLLVLVPVLKSTSLSGF